LRQIVPFPSCGRSAALVKLSGDLVAWVTWSAIFSSSLGEIENFVSLAMVIASFVSHLNFVWAKDAFLWKLSGKTAFLVKLSAKTAFSVKLSDEEIEKGSLENLNGLEGRVHAHSVCGSGMST